MRMEHLVLENLTNLQQLGISILLQYFFIEKQPKTILNPGY